jgi:hypothetical protein
MGGKNVIRGEDFTSNFSTPISMPVSDCDVFGEIIFLS